MAFAGIDSRVLLRRVYDDLKAAGWQVSNVDSTVVAQVPKLAPYIPQMRELLATDLHIESSEINIKATTTEKLGFVGRQEGIAAHAVALIQKAESVFSGLAGATLLASEYLTIFPFSLISYPSSFPTALKYSGNESPKPPSTEAVLASSCLLTAKVESQLVSI